MSYFIKLVNETILSETNQVCYQDMDSVERLIFYILDVNKTNFDSARPGHVLGEFNGCIPFIGPEYMSHDPFEAACMMKLLLSVYSSENSKLDLVKHRIISFHKYDYILPADAYNLARYIIQSLYRDYLCIFGVHLDTNQIHIHFAISAYDRCKGNRFNVAFEVNEMRNLTDRFIRSLDSRMDNSKNGVERYEKYLFGR